MTPERLRVVALVGLACAIALLVVVLTRGSL